jgi:hypothetical protein
VAGQFSETDPPHVQVPQIGVADWLTRCSEETIMAPLTGTPEGSKPHALNFLSRRKNRHMRLQSESAAQRKADDQRGG